MNPFRVKHRGYFYTSAIYDNRGRELLDLATAAKVAEDLYGVEWEEVYNGVVGVSREEWLTSIQDPTAPSQERR